MTFDESQVKVIAAILSTLAAIAVALIANSKAKRISSAPDKPLAPAEIFHNQELREHDLTRDLLRDVRNEMRNRFDGIESKVVGDPGLKEYLRKLDRLQQDGLGTDSLK